MGNRYLIVSDLHLSDVEDHDDGWKAHKSSRYTFDASFSELLDRFMREEANGRFVLVLNGDIFDFDLVTAVPDKPEWPVRFSERRRGLDATAGKSAWKLQRILDHHPVFLDALARFVGLGHDVVYVLGNHDRELHFDEVRRVLEDALAERVRAQGGEPEGDFIRFEPWFYAVPGEVYVEHGQQYDLYSSFRYLFSPVVRSKGREMIALPMGNLSNRYLMSRMGFFNPHSSDYILNVFRYLKHWLTCYAFTRRSLVLNWFWGSLVVIGKLLANKRRLQRENPRLQEHLREQAERHGLRPGVIEALVRLQAPPITSRFFRIIREFWIDRVLIALVMTGGTVTLALVSIPLWIKLMVPLTAFPLLYLIYEWAVRGETIFAIEKRLPQVARKIAGLVPVQVVTFGHTHVPRLIPLARDLCFVDTGTWAPITRHDSPGILSPGYRNYLQVSFEEDRSRIDFGSWMEKEP